MSKVVEIAKQLVEPLAVECDVEVIDIEYRKTLNGMELTFYIDTDREGGIGLGDCEKLHRLIDVALEEADPTEGVPYRLNVSSPGIDRPLKNERDYIKHLNKNVVISLYKTSEYGKKFVGQLLKYDLNASNITVSVNGKDVQLNLIDVAIVKPDIKF